eukprot:4962723-Prymnesium_polylepis.2
MARSHSPVHRRVLKRGVLRAEIEGPSTLAAARSRVQGAGCRVQGAAVRPWAPSTLAAARSRPQASGAAVRPSDSIAPPCGRVRSHRSLWFVRAAVRPSGSDIARGTRQPLLPQSAPDC